MRKKILRYLLLTVLVAAVVLVCAPVLTAAGIRGWIWWATRGQKLHCTIEGIDAALFRPVTLRGVRLSGNAELQIEATAPRVIVGLNLRSIFRMRGHALRSLTAENLRVQIRRRQARPFFPRSAWRECQRLLPDNFKITGADLQYDQGTTSIAIHGLSINGSPIENGRVEVGDAFISSPILRQRFDQLRGAVTWQEDRLTISALTLAGGLDIRSITADLSELGAERIGLEADIDAFRGKIRTNLSNDWSSQPSNWDAAGSANDISLEQISRALGFNDQVQGSLHACKFTFRGNAHDPKHATASLWTELTRLSWQRRAADVIMIGASLYNQQVQLQQLYVRQSANQLSASGEAVFPKGNFDWFNPNFSGNISASINDLGAFANLFGAAPGDFAGQIAIEGTINASDRKFGGHLSATGGALSLFKTQFESLGAKFSLTSKAFQIEQLELHRQKDLLSGDGTIELAGEHLYSGKARIAAAKLSDYAGLIPQAWRGVVTDGRMNAEWSGHGKAGAHTGEFHLHGTSLKAAAKTDLLPFKAELDAEYSPGKMFFRQAHFSNEHASLNGFVTFSGAYTQAQGIAFDLNGKPVLRGNLFLPVSGSQLAMAAPLGDLADAEQKADLDLNLETLDLRELSGAIFSHSGLSGKISSRLSIFGTVSALQGWADFHGRDISLPNDSSRFSFDGEARVAGGNLQSRASLQFSGADPIAIDASTPIFNRTAASAPERELFTLNLNFPAVFLARIPRFFSHDLFRDGILSGKLSLTGPRAHPNVSGDLQLTNGKFNPTRVHLSDASARMVFQGREASIEFLNLADGNLLVALRGKARFDERNKMHVQFSAAGALSIVEPRPDGRCVNDLRVVAPGPGRVSTKTENLGVSGGADFDSWSLTIDSPPVSPENEQGTPVAPIPKTYPLCLGATVNGAPLILGVEPSASPGPVKTRAKKPRRSR